MEDKIYTFDHANELKKIEKNQKLTPCFLLKKMLYLQSTKLEEVYEEKQSTRTQKSMA